MAGTVGNSGGCTYNWNWLRAIDCGIYSVVVIDFFFAYIRDAPLLKLELQGLLGCLDINGP